MYIYPLPTISALYKVKLGFHLLSEIENSQQNTTKSLQKNDVG
jgi:hypothetical protein